MNKRWIMVIDCYQGLSKQAVNAISGTMSGYLDYVLPVKTVDTVTEEILRGNHLIVIGRTGSNRLLRACQEKGWLDVPTEAEGYSVYVGQSVLDAQAQMIAIAGFDEPGLLYGCMDFCNRYCGDMLYRKGYLWGEKFFAKPFDRELTPWRTACAPAIKTRAIWTWGHVIYNYRDFFDNMAKLRLNEVVIWNDCVPVNANDVVEYAHSLGIRVIWGFAWGWTNGCEKYLNDLDANTLQQLREDVLQIYEREYAHTEGDGIYFQSFTELTKDYVGGKCIAQIVTELVNDIAGALLEKNPDLHIQFGLHATSVKTHLDVIAQTDPRVHIVWEDCGAFPYDYRTEQIGDFEQTMALTSQLLTLRGPQEKFGAVLKGMLNLDWFSFEHFTEPYVLGQRTGGYIKARQADKNRIWKIVQAGWLRNGEYARKTVALMAKEGNCPVVQALVEDAMFENEIMLPVALFAELLWNPETDLGELTEQVAKYPCVKFANV